MVTFICPKCGYTTAPQPSGIAEVWHLCPQKRGHWQLLEAA